MNSHSALLPTTDEVQDAQENYVGSSTDSLIRSELSSASESTPKTSHTDYSALKKVRVQDLLREINPTELLTEDAEDLLIKISDSFIDNTMRIACLLAKHRQSKQVDVRDVQLHLENNCGIWMQEFCSGEMKAIKRHLPMDAHVQKMNLIKKSLKDNDN